MVEIGKINSLRIVKGVEFGIYLDGEEYGEILMPSRYVPEVIKIEENIDVFIYRDSEDRVIATTETPIAMVGEIASLKAVAVNSSGAFLDWGLPKDLFVPVREQVTDMMVGKNYVVAIYLDEKSDRIAASTKVEKYIEKEPVGFFEGQQVELLIYRKTQLGYLAIINKRFEGILYLNEVFRKLNIGDITTGYIKKIRDDDKIDLSLSKQGYVRIEGLAGRILDMLEKNGGYLNLTDKSPSDEIYELFGESKKSFKMALGQLYKQRLIKLEKEGIWKA